MKGDVIIVLFAVFIMVLPVAPRIHLPRGIKRNSKNSNAFVRSPLELHTGNPRSIEIQRQRRSAIQIPIYIIRSGFGSFGNIEKFGRNGALYIANEKKTKLNNIATEVTSPPIHSVTTPKLIFDFNELVA